MINYTFNDYLEHWALHRSKLVALADAEGELTFRELLNRVRSLQGYFYEEIGLRTGDTVGISSPRCVSLVLIYLAALGLGLSVVPLPEQLEANHYNKILALIPMDALVSLEGNTGHSRTEYCLKRTGKTEGDTRAAVEYFFVPHELGYRHIRHNYSSMEEQAIYYNLTSGSTGDIKSVRAGSREIILNAWLVDRRLPLKAGDCYCCLFAPDMHPHELFTRPIVFGAACLLLNNHSLRSFGGYMRRYQITHLLATPHTLTNLLLICPEEKDWLSVQYLIGSGESVSYVLREKFYTQVGQKLLIAWGCTETTGIVLVVPEELFLQKGSILGSPVQGYEIRIEKDTQELLIRGECVMKEYWKSTEPPPVDGYGYYHTGDLVEQGPGGLLAFAGRRDAFIKAGGRKVSLYGLEQQIRQIQGIRETAVLYSDISHTLGVFYSGEADAHAAYIDILELMNHMLSQAQFRIIERSELPKLTSGKLDKQRLVAELH